MTLEQFDTYSSLVISIVVFVAPLIIFLSIFIPLFVVDSKYKKFILEHSVALKELDQLNKKYRFKKVANFDMTHSYDNEKYFGMISCQDYLIYQLVYLKNKIVAAMNNALENKLFNESYLKEVNAIYSHLNRYDIDELLKNRKRLIKTEKVIFNSHIQRPVTCFSINVVLVLTDINGRKRTSKRNAFSTSDIRYLNDRMANRRGNFYLDEEIWQSICRVERGKVTNKMRFAIYNRDGYRCCICGRKTNDLEIDHIYPIAKGGKSTIDNLQTLCHRCNARKGDSVY